MEGELLGLFVGGGVVVDERWLFAPLRGKLEEGSQLFSHGQGGIGKSLRVPVRCHVGKCIA